MQSTGSRAVCDLYDVAMLDLDGVVYVGGEAVPGAPGYLAQARAAGQKLAFVTNNAVRTPETVAAHLSELGVPAQSADVVTSAQAAAGVLAARLPAGSRVAMVGAAGLRTALEAVGLVPVAVADPEAVAIVNGYAPQAQWQDIMRAAVRIRDGLWWVASNTDLTIPTAYGTAPGNGVLVEMLQRFSGVEPTVGGKPDRPLLDETIRRVGATSPLMVGDRLDTDILGGTNAGVDTLLVMTGVTGVAELVSAPVPLRPTYVSADLHGLLTAHEVPVIDQGQARLGGWTAGVGSSGRLEVSGAGAVDDWWRVVAGAGWAWMDTRGTAVDVEGLTPPDHR